MTLIIAEKPSVAMSLAKVLGVRGRRNGYMEGEGWLVSWCVGHLAELAPADVYDPRYSKWDYGDLPIVPKDWMLQILPATKQQFDTLSALMNDQRVDEIVCATDAGREGELIFRLVYRLSGCGKTVKRLWISSMEESAIREGLNHLKDSAAYDNLYEAALCRAKADWLIGINGTRLFTLAYGSKTLNVGRVLTPTLALIVEREAAIKDFKKEKFYTVELDLSTFRAVSPRFPTRKEAERVRSSCIGRPVMVQAIERQNRTEHPPKLYDLTTLQREANRLFDYTAQETLDYAQLLYEKRLITYPRTDSRYLTNDMGDMLPALCNAVRGTLPFARDSPDIIHAAPVLNSAKVSDHHALIPTTEIAHADLASLPTGERNILYMIAVRLLCAVNEAHQYTETVVTLDCGGVLFSSKGRNELDEGWKAIEGAFFATLKKKPEEEALPALPELRENDALDLAGAAVKEGSTRAPSRFTEGSLLSAMERASAEDFAKIEDVERPGLGTPATRAATIEKLIRAGYVERKKKLLVPTALGVELIRVVPEQLKSAKLTAEWEEKLSKVQHGRLSPDEFMSGIVVMVKEFVSRYKSAVSAAPRAKRIVVGVCPRCGKNVVEGKKSFFCEGYYGSPQCGFALWKNDRFFLSQGKELNRNVAVELLKSGRIHMNKLYSEKKGVYYDATVIMQDDGGPFVKYALEFDKK